MKSSAQSQPEGARQPPSEMRPLGITWLLLKDTMFRSQQFIAIAVMCLGMLFIPLGDTAGKLLTSNNAISPFFVGWSRFVIGAFLVFILFRGRGFNFNILRDWRIWLRAALITGAISCILTALRTEPIANVFAAFFVGPILSYFGSAILLKEPISKWRTLLLFVGFTGVLLVVKPGFDFSAGVLFALLAGTFYGSFLVASKWLAHLANPRSLLLSHLLIGALFLTPLGIREVPPMTLDISMLVILSAAASALGNLLYLVANKMADASRLAPLVYVQLVSATILGILVFGDYPDAISLFGLALLLTSGFSSYLIANKRRRNVK
ncbi:MAG: DMT family transporter [Salaquimonas sp.]